MFKQIVVGVDQRAGGDDALALARQLIAPDGESTSAFVLSGTSNDRDIAPTLLRVQARSVARGLHELASEQDADLLVVGSCHRTRMGRVLIGDDTRATLHDAPCAVAVAPAGYARESNGLHRLGVGYDESFESERAIALARQLAHAYGAELSAFQALAVPLSTHVTGNLAPSPRVTELAARARSQMEQQGLEPHIGYGDPAKDLSVYSASVDLLLVGSRGYGQLGRLFYGSTSSALARSARCPLLVLPPPAGIAGGLRTARSYTAA